MVRRKIRDAADARACLQAVAASGLTRPAWAAEHGVDARSLNMWRLNLERYATKEEQGPLRLVELVPSRHARRRQRYLVHVGDLAVEVDEHFDADVLGRLLTVMSAC